MVTLVFQSVVYLVKVWGSYLEPTFRVVSRGKNGFIILPIIRKWLNDNVDVHSFQLTFVGRKVGFSVGFFDGLEEGMNVGLKVGAKVGLCVGTLEGLKVRGECVISGDCSALRIDTPTGEKVGVLVLNPCAIIGTNEGHGLTGEKVVADGGGCIICSVKE